jgi:hypothetical protein
MRFDRLWAFPKGTEGFQHKIFESEAIQWFQILRLFLKEAGQPGAYFKLIPVLAKVQQVCSLKPETNTDKASAWTFAAHMRLCS